MQHKTCTVKSHLNDMNYEKCHKFWASVIKISTSIKSSFLTGLTNKFLSSFSLSLFLCVNKPSSYQWYKIFSTQQKKPRKKEMNECGSTLFIVCHVATIIKLYAKMKLRQRWGSTPRTNYWMYETREIFIIIFKFHYYDETGWMGELVRGRDEREVIKSEYKKFVEKKYHKICLAYTYEFHWCRYIK